MKVLSYKQQAINTRAMIIQLMRMDEMKAVELFFKAFCNKCRFGIMKMLLERPMSVTEIASMSGLEQSHASHHLRELLKSGLIEVEVEGHVHRYRMSGDMKAIVRVVIKHVKKYHMQSQ